MSKKNIGAALALYPCPVIVVGAMADGKPTWTLAAHAGIMAHSHLMVGRGTLHQPGHPGDRKALREHGGRVVAG